MDFIVLWDKIRFVTSLSNEVWLHCQLPIGIQVPAEPEGQGSVTSSLELSLPELRD